VPGATGTDTGGSIRQPAAFTGISGIKPTYGRCSRWGVVSFASSLDQAGPMARDVRDCAILLENMAGFDVKDSTSLNLAVPEWEKNLSGNLRGLKVGIPDEYLVEGMPPEIAALWQQGIDWVKDAGAEVVEVSLPHTKYRCRPITSSRPPRLPRTSLAMMASAMACAICPKVRTCRTCTRRPARPASARKCSGGS
jgi:aspartyl-tRNA(Asn)/glutamyl-tRNA(Gln) amidotransferase subunit A